MIIFDFDGTLADSLPILIDEYSRWSGLDEQPSPEMIAKMRNMTAVQALKTLKIPLYRVPGLLVRGREALRYRINEVQLFDGMKPVIKDLAKDNRLYIMSSNSQVNIELFLKRYGLDKYFTRVQGDISIFGKTQQIRLFLKRNKVDKAECIYVGDETRDIEAAKRAKITVASVTWGYNGEQILKKYKPDYLINKPKDLLEIVK